MSNQGTIVVTGGAGYIGSHTIISLIENTQFNVVSIDNFSNSDVSVFDRIREITGVQIKNYNIDLCNKIEVEEVFEKEKNVLAVIHFAAYKSVPESVENPYKYYHNNIESLLNILEACKRNKIHHFIFSSSCSVYGNIDQLPVNEETELNKPESPYAHTKQIGEKILESYSVQSDDVQMIALRYFNPAGAHASGKNGELPINPPTSLIPVITQTAIGKKKAMFVYGDDYATRDGSCIRDYVHVVDIAEAHIVAMNYLLEKKNKQNFSIFNLGTGQGVSVLEAVKTFERITNLKLNYSIEKRRPGDVEAIYSDNSKTAKELGWNAKYSLEEMISSAWEWEKNLDKERKRN